MTPALFLAILVCPPSSAPQGSEPRSEQSGRIKHEVVVAEEQNGPANRTQLNIRGATDTAGGESRRNDNVHFNPIDNNGLRDLNVRLGVSATIVPEFEPRNKYFGAEHGMRPETPGHVLLTAPSAIHGTAFEAHSNSVFSARSFFQVGKVRPAHENNYGFSLGVPFGRGTALTLDGAQQRMRGSVNGNVLVPNAAERMPLTTDLEVRPIVERLLAAYPAEVPNRLDIADRALNTNSPQRLDTDRANGTIAHQVAERDRFAVRYSLVSQQVESFQFVSGQYPNTGVRADTAQITWVRSLSANTHANFSASFSRLRTTLSPEKRAVGPTVTVWVIQSLAARGESPSAAVGFLLAYKT